MLLGGGHELAVGVIQLGENVFDEANKKIRSIDSVSNGQSPAVVREAVVEAVNARGGENSKSMTGKANFRVHWNSCNRVLV